MKKTFYKPAPYYGPNKASQTFVKIPWLLFYEPYDNLSIQAKILYGLLLDRMAWKYRDPQKWNDGEGAYVYYQRAELMQLLKITEKTATKLFSELEEVGLISRKRQGFGKPTKIYVNEAARVQTEDPEAEPEEEKTPENQRGNISPNDQRGNISPSKRGNISPSREGKNPPLPNKTFSNQLESINQSGGKAAETNETPSESAVAVACEEMESQVAAQIDKQGLYTQYPQNRGTIDTIAGIMADELTSDRPAAKIGGATRARADIRARLLAVTAADVAAILDAMRERPPAKMTNPRGYLLTCLYNAPAIRMDKQEQGKKEKGESELWKYAHQLKREREKKKAAQAAKKDYVGDIMRERQEAAKAAAQRLKEEISE